MYQSSFELSQTQSRIDRNSEHSELFNWRLYEADNDKGWWWWNRPDLISFQFQKSELPQKWAENSRGSQEPAHKKRKKSLSSFEASWNVDDDAQKFYLSFSDWGWIWPDFKFHVCHLICFWEFFNFVTNVWGELLSSLAIFFEVESLHFLNLVLSATLYFIPTSHWISCIIKLEWKYQFQKIF